MLDAKQKLGARELRRKAEREEAKKRKANWPDGPCQIPDDPSLPLNAGDRFTIAGLRRMSDGRITWRCKPGNETVFVATAHTVGEPLIKPAILRKKK